MKKLLVVAAMFAVVLPAAAQKAPVMSAKGKSALEALGEAAVKAQSGAKASSPQKAAEAGQKAFDGKKQTMPVTAPKATPAATTADDGIIFPEEPTPAKPKEGQEEEPPQGPADQVAKLIAEALQKPEVTKAIDKVREDQMNKVFSTPVKVGMAVGGAGILTAGIGLITGISAVTGVGLAILGAVILAGALFALFKKKSA